MNKTVETAGQKRSRSLRRRGVVILSLFALLWAAVGASGLSSGPAWVLRIAAVVVSAAAILLTFRSGGPGASERHRRQPTGWYRLVGLINVVQFVAIGLVVLISIRAGTPQLVPPLVCLIVGVHFFPLARLFDQRQYNWTAAGLCVAAGAGLGILAVGFGPEASRAAVGLAAASTLWATSVHLALRG